MIYFDFNHYGESLDSTPDFLFMKQHYYEDLESIYDVDFLEENKDFSIFVDPTNLKENNKSSKQKEYNNE